MRVFVSVLVLALPRCRHGGYLVSVDCVHWSPFAALWRLRFGRTGPKRSLMRLVTQCSFHEHILGETLGEGVQNQPITATGDLGTAVQEAERGRVVILVCRKMNEILSFADRVFAPSKSHILHDETTTVIDAGLIEKLVRAKVKNHSRAAGRGFIEPDW